MEFEVKPYEGAGEITFEQTPEQVREILGTPSFTGRQSSDSRGMMDAFKERGIVVHYTGDETVGMIEFSGPDAPTYDGQNLLEVEKPDEWIDDHDDDEAEIMPPDYISEKLGISFYKPPVGLHSVGIFEQGYYD